MLNNSSVKKSLEQLLGKEFMEAVIQGAVYFHGMDEKEARRISTQEIDFLPKKYEEKMDELLDKVGERVIKEMVNSPSGAPTNSFKDASKLNASPVGGFGFYRLGEDGRLYLVSKSEHYHTPLGHAFPGYKLIDNARVLGISNATHNNTRGYITRLLEQELIRTTNGLSRDDKDGLKEVLGSNKPHVLNRVINLETGSLAVEAGVKMMLARFYKLEAVMPKPRYEDKIPVFFVMADNEGGRKANYHGTTIITQTMRDLWPDFYSKLDNAEIIKVCSVKINDYNDFKEKFEKYNTGKYKVAGFMHEIVLMNYGGIKLKKDFLKKVYSLCHDNDTPILCDEIQSCMWYPGMYLFKEYELNPDFVVIGKGFPGGQYASSRIITTADMDSLNQFGALVTNGQQELAALSYLITMEFTQANEQHIGSIGEYYESKVKNIAKNYNELIECVEGKELLLTVYFYKPEKAVQFCKILNEQCIDISAHTYKAMCPPSALTKLPIIATKKMVDFMVEKMDNALKEIQ